MNQQTCPHCGIHDLPSGAGVCPSCGQSIIGAARKSDDATEEIVVAELVAPAGEEKEHRHRGAIQSRVIGVIFVVLALLGTANSLLTMVLPAPRIASTNPDPNIAQAAQRGQEVARAAGSPVVLVLYLVMLVGAAAMIMRQHWGLALTAAIIAMVPCSPGFLIGLPVGVWALVFLNLSGMKESFRGSK